MMFYDVCAVFFTLFDIVWIPEVEDQGDPRERTHFLLFTSFTENIVFDDVCVERITVFYGVRGVNNVNNVKKTT